jgi:hypothetical protein
MRVLTQEWVDKVEGDFHTATREALHAIKVVRAFVR